MPSSEYRFMFSLGPVQSAISLARSVRDLWTGSYTISWLTARAAAEALKAGATFDDPQWEAAPLVSLHRGMPPKDPQALLRSALPNTFSVFHAADDPDAFGDLLCKAAHKEWLALAEAVRAALSGHLQLREKNGWDEGWTTQIEHAWTFRVDYVPLGPSLKDAAKALGAGDIAEDQLPAELLARVSAASKLLRPVKPHGDPNDRRPKCTITGEDSQMGPTTLSLADHTKWWESIMAEAVKKSGERLRAGERLSAPSLVKRLSWACYFSGKTGHERDALKTTDTATIAAGPWIARLRILDPPIPNAHQFLHQLDDWSGQWLHREEDKEEQCPAKVRDMIRAAKAAEGAPPAYYVALHMDGDHLGRRLREYSAEKRRGFSKSLSRFAGTTVPDIITEYLWGRDGLQFNQPVYAGGDDVLALLPLWMPKRPGSTAPFSAVGLAAAIARAFAGLKQPGDLSAPTMSAGLAVCHYKTDLREVLEASREAEKSAKNPKRNRLCLAVHRRSGEHASALLPWDQVPLFDSLVAEFVQGASDRWAYQLRGVVDELTTSGFADQAGRGIHEESQFVDLIDAEALRLIAHSDQTDQHKELFREAWDSLTRRPSNGAIASPAPASRIHAEQINALTLIQSASFIARGREEGRS